MNIGSRSEHANVVAPAAGVDHNGIRALVVATVDEEPGRGGPPHFSESDLVSALHGAQFC